MKNLTLTQKQREILIGCILGDVHLKTVTAGKTFRCYFQQGGSGKHCHKEYLFHLYDCFQNLCTPELKPRQLEKGGWAFETRTLGTFSFYGNLFYPIDVRTGKRTKRLPTRPNLLKKLISPISIAYWFMDDGSQKSKQSKGLILNTHCFTYKEIQLLCSILKEKFHLNAKPRKQQHCYKGSIRIYYQIYISGHSFEKFTGLVYEYLHPSMLYKWPLPCKGKKTFKNKK